MDYSYIKTTQQRNLFGVPEIINHEWVGKSPFVSISGDMIEGIADYHQRHNSIVIGPYKLRFVERFLHSDTYVYVKDSPYGRLLEFGYKTTRWLDLVYRRVLMTLAVWRLADYEHYRLQTWQDVKFLKWLIKK